MKRNSFLLLVLLKMIKSITDTIADYQLSFLSRKHEVTLEKFNGFFTTSKSVFILLPFDNNLLPIVNELIDYLILKQKKITIFSTVHNFNKIASMNNCSLFEYTNDEITRVGLPNGYLIKRLQRESFDILINLESKINTFYAAITKLSHSKYKLGYGGIKNDKYFNIQIPSLKSENSILGVVKILNLF